MITQPTLEEIEAVLGDDIPALDDFDTEIPTVILEGDQVLSDEQFAAYWGPLN